MKQEVQGRGTHCSYFTDYNIYRESEEELKRKYFRANDYRVQHFKPNLKNKEVN